jgi:hypothetical protein
MHRFVFDVDLSAIAFRSPWMRAPAYADVAAHRGEVADDLAVHVRVAAHRDDVAERPTVDARVTAHRDHRAHRLALADANVGAERDAIADPFELVGARRWDSISGRSARCRSPLSRLRERAGVRGVRVRVRVRVRGRARVRLWLV